MCNTLKKGKTWQLFYLNKKLVLSLPLFVSTHQKVLEEMKFYIDVLF